MSFIIILSQYRELILIFAEMLLMYISISFAMTMVAKLKKSYDESNLPENSVRLGAEYTGSIGETARQNMLRRKVAPDGVDPSPNSYLGISDGGREYYVRNVTLSKLPQDVEYAETLKKLLAYPGCSSTIFVEPKDEEEMEKEIDKQIDILEAERITAAGETNRQRKLVGQERELSNWAEDLENGEKKFFNVGFLFSFVSDNVDTLNRITDDFRALALNKKMDISNCFAVQSEAFLSAAPFNRKAKVFFGKIDSDCVKMHPMDEKGVSIVLHYTTDYYSHKIGVPLGRNLFTGLPFLYNQYDPSHYGFTEVHAGKTRSGKTAAIQMRMHRNILLGYRYVVIDSQAKKGTSEGEYAATIQMNGGVHFQISSKKNNILNAFEVKESVEWIKTGIDTGYDRRTLDLNGAILEILWTLRAMMQIGLEEKDEKLDAVMDSDINAILLRVIKELFEERGIIHDDPDSLYEEATVVKNAVLQSGTVPKKLPTVSDCMKKIMLEQKNNNIRDLDGVYRFIINNLQENARELLYTEESRQFFTRQEYENLPADENGKKYYIDGDKKEKVIAFYGTRPYFDGQTSHIFSDDDSVDLDISQLSETEKKVARTILTRFMIEQFVKKNSEHLGSDDKLVCIIDEAHENFLYKYCRETYAAAARTAAKRFVGLIFATQTVVEWERYNETNDILRQAAVKMVYRQEAQDQKKLVELLDITESQAYYITHVLGVGTDSDDPEIANRHKGEVCIKDGDNVTFIKVDYMKQTEQLSVEADVSTMLKNVNALHKAG